VPVRYAVGMPKFYRRGSVARCCTLLLAAQSAPCAGSGAAFELDPEHTTVAFLVAHIGYAKVLGQFGSVEGSYRFDGESGELTDVSVVVQTASVNTQHGARDKHVKSGDFLNAERFPRMTFTATGARRTGEGTYEVAGELELLGRSRPLILHATLNKSAEYPIGDRAYVMGVSARGTLKRSDFGMTYAVDNGWVADEVEIVVEFEARRR
jgi:polyisoprenoid-binding protein YceI